MLTSSRDHAYQIFHFLEQHYPDAKMILEWGNNFELLVAIILSAQCTDVMVNKVTAKLFPKYKQRKEDRESRRHYEADMEKIRISREEMIEIINFAYTPLEELEQDIKSTGFYHNKAKSIHAAAKMILEKYHGQIPNSMQELITIPGVGRKTANVFLGNAHKIYEGIAVDTHVSKQSQLLGLTKSTKPDKIEQDLMNLFDKKDWFKLTYLLIAHGRNMRKKKGDRLTCTKKECILCSQ